MAAPRDTSLGGQGRAFPSTRWTLIAQAGQENSPGGRAALDALCRLYWKPIYAYIRAARGKANEEAKDLTQEFLLELISGALLTRYSSDRGSFRAYLRGALHLFLLDRHRSEGCLKRGGALTVVPLGDDETRAVDSAVAPGATPEEVFDRQWVNAVIDLAVQQLKEEMTQSGKEVQFRVFDRYALHRPTKEGLTYGEMASEFGIKETDVTNYIAACRRELRAKIIDQVRDYAASEAEVAEEIGKYFRI